MRQWYFIHTYSGHENKVVESLNARIRDLELQDLLRDVIFVLVTFASLWLTTPIRCGQYSGLACPSKPLSS